MARLYSYLASQLDFLKNDIIKVLELNAENKLDIKEFTHMFNKLCDTLELFEEKADLTDYFAKYTRKNDNQ